ncbi:MAG: alkaline phosphatase [Clostridia bacterium]|nr:alkaline phosphatase [Clostridia bacterium]
MKNKTLKIFALFLVILFVLPTAISCANNEPAVNDQTTDGQGTDTTATVAYTLNGAAISEYTVVYSESGLDFNKRAAEYISREIESATGVTLQVKLDTETADTGKEILVGITNRDADAFNVEEFEDVFKFASVTKGDSVLLYGEEYMIAGAAYDLVKKLSESKDVTVPGDLTVGEPVFEDANNVIFIISDGMGFNSLKFGAELYADNAYPLSENISGYHQYIVADRLPHKAQSYTHSLDSDITDSAAGGTALATGYKTYNDVIALNGDLEEVKSLTELAYELGKKTAVLTTDDQYGATPSAFSAHTLSRDDDDEIIMQQFVSSFTTVTGLVRDPAAAIRKTLDNIGDSEKGIFVMYEEAHIDKASHDNNRSRFYTAYTRLNTALRTFLEFMMYNPDTVIILTADHETGGIKLNENTGKYGYTDDGHTQVNVPFYAIGKGTEVIDGKTYDNTGVSKFAARIMGVENFGDPTLSELTDKTGEEKMTADEINAIAIKRVKVFRDYGKK